MAGRLAALVDRVHRQPELTAVWLLIGLVGVAVIVTYARLPASELYNVSESGIGGGLGRSVVFLGFPVSLAMLVIVPVAYDLAAAREGRPLLAATAVGALALCLTIAIPGVLEEDDLDVKWANAFAAVGVALALAVTIAALRANGPPAPPWARGDTVRIAVALTLLVAALPWIAAELGLYLPGHLFLTHQIRPFAGETGTGLGPAVHHGDHHGLSGVELALVALALSRVVPRLSSAWRRPLSAVLVSLLLVYGLANAVQDFWLEQVVKRGWTDHRIPSLLRPGPSLAWAALGVATVLVYLLLFRKRREPPRKAIIAA